MPIGISTREPRQAVIDRFLLLCTGDVLAEVGARPGKVAIQKIVFQQQLRLATEAIRAPGFRFVRWTYGPFSAELASDVRQLISAGLLTTGHSATPRGREIADHFRHLLEWKNAEVFAAVDAETRKRAHWSAQKTMKEAYAVQVQLAPGKLVALRDVEMGERFAFQLGNARSLDVDDELLQDLVVSMRLRPRALAGARLITDETTRRTEQLLGL